jgi:hypothetical protein
VVIKHSLELVIKMDMEESEFSEDWPEFVVQPYPFKSVADIFILTRDNS